MERKKEGSKNEHFVSRLCEKGEERERESVCVCVCVYVE